MCYVFKEPKREYQPPELQKARVREYLIDLVQEHTLKNGRKTHQIVYMHESYLHANHIWRNTWVNNDGEVLRNPSKGQRVTIAHTINMGL